MCNYAFCGFQELWLEILCIYFNTLLEVFSSVVGRSGPKEKNCTKQQIIASLCAGKIVKKMHPFGSTMAQMSRPAQPMGMHFEGGGNI